MGERLAALIPRHVEFMPRHAEKEHGVLYISRRFELAIHLCACGCGGETVTPFKDHPNDRGWDLTETPDGLVTLRPSIGNQHWECGSHYWITENRIVWL